MKTRPATLQEVAHIATLYKDSMVEVGDPEEAKVAEEAGWFYDQTEKLIKSDEGGATVLVDDTDEIAGFILYAAIPRPYTYKGYNRVGLIIKVSVKPTFRRLANLRMLFRAVREWCGENGIQKVQAAVEPGFELAYSRFGCTTECTIMTVEDI